MQTGSTPNGSTSWRSLVAKILIGLAGVAIITLAISFLEFSPPLPPEPPLYRIFPDVIGLQFYDADCTEPGDKHLYSYRFAKGDARCVFVQLHSSCFSSVDNPSQAFLHVLFYGPDGPVIKEERLPIAKDSSSVTIMAKIGWDEPGPWQPGIYRVELIVGDKLIAADEFQISDP